MGVVYTITTPSADDQCIYIGQTCSLPRRQAEHFKTMRSGKNSPLCSWLRKRINEGHQPRFDVLEVVDTEWDLDERERFWQTYYRSLGWKCKWLKDGQRHTNSGWVPTSETRQRMSVSASRRTHSPETRQRISESLRKNGPLSTDRKQRISDALRGRPSPKRGSRLSQGQREKISIVHQGHVTPPEVRAKIAETLRRKSSVQGA